MRVCGGWGEGVWSEGVWRVCGGWGEGEGVWKVG